MNTAFTNFLTWFVDEIPDFLMSEPLIYFVAMALLCFVCKIFITLCRKGVS